MANDYADSLNVMGRDVLLAPAASHLIVNSEAVGITARTASIPDYYLDSEAKLSFRVLFLNGWNAAFTLNVNGLGATDVRVFRGGSLVSLNATGDAGTVLEMFYNGEYFIVVGNPKVHVGSTYNEYADGTNSYTATQVNGALAKLETITFSSNFPKVLASKNNKIIDFYGPIEDLTTTTTLEYFTTFKPCITWVMFPIYSTSTPYAPIGSIWINSSGRIMIYKPANITSVYISGSYILA